MLDVGCGPGVAIALAARPDATVAGVDPSAVMVAQARRRNRRAIAAGLVTVAEGAAERLPFPDVSFDAVLAVNSLTHWRSRDDGLREVARVLGPGGRLVLLLRLRDPGAGRATRAAYGFPAGELPQLAAALCAAGLEVTAEERRTTDGELTVAVLATRSRPGMGRRSPPWSEPANRSHDPIPAWEPRGNERHPSATEAHDDDDGL